MTKIAIAVIVLAVLAGVGYFLYTLYLSPYTSPTLATSTPTATYTVPPLTTPYENAAHRFSLKMPEGFTARTIAGDGSETVLLEDTGHPSTSSGQAGIQIVISPYDNVKVLTGDDIQNAIPDMRMQDTQPVDIGSDYIGVAFKSDNESFDGASREVWFVYKSELYQISTYERLDPLLKAIFGTWNFSQ